MQTQPPLQLQTPDRLIIAVVDKAWAHKPQHVMLILSVDYRPRPKFSMQTNGSPVTPKTSRAQKVEYFDRVICVVGPFAASMKVFTRGLSTFRYSVCRQHRNHGRKLVYATTGIWHNISQHLGIVGSKKLVELDSGISRIQFAQHQMICIYEALILRLFLLPLCLIQAAQCGMQG